MTKVWDLDDRPIERTKPRCPSCQSDIALSPEGSLDRWMCPDGHGLGLTLSEAHDRVQEDELDLMWQTARKAEGTSTKPCGLCHKPMVAVTVAIDDDEVKQSEAGDGEDTGSAELDVCVDCQFIWFDTGELFEFPEDVAEPEPTADELAKIEQIRQEFGQAVEAGFRARDNDEPWERVTNRVFGRMARHRGLLRGLTYLTPTKADRDLGR